MRWGGSSNLGSYVGTRGLGKHDQAIDWVNKACEQRDGLCAYFNVAPLHDPLRRNPRYQALLRRMNFPAQPWLSFVSSRFTSNARDARHELMAA